MKHIAVLALVWLSSPFVLHVASAQQRLDMPELSVSMDVPTSWTDTKTWKVTDHLPESGLYHVMDLDSGQAISVLQCACTTDKQRRAWTRGETGRKQLRPGDKRTRARTSIRLGTADAFELTSPRDRITYKAYVFYTTAGDRCYEVSMLAPEAVFAASEAVFRELSQSIVFAAN